MKSRTPSFVIELGLKTGEDQESALETYFSDARQLFNAVLGTAKKRVRAMKSTEAWKLTAAMPKGKDRNKRFKEIQKSASLSEYALHDVVKEHRAKGGFTKRIGINEAQKIATRVWQGIERWLLHQGGQPRFKSAKRGLHSVEGKSNKTGLRWKAKTGTLEVLDLVIKAEAPDAWQKEALLSATDPSGFKRVKYCRLVRRMIRGRMRYFVQLIVEGVPPVKHVYAPKDLKVAADPGPRTMTFYSPEWQQKILVSAGTVSQEKEIARLLRAMDRSRRDTNRECYNADGTVKAAGKKIVWKESKTYKATKAKLADLYRRQAETRRCLHGEVINQVFGRAGTVIVEKNSYKAFQRAGYGKSLGKSGIAGLITRMTSKAESAGCCVVEVSPRKLRPSQHDPETGTYRKKALWERSHQLGDTGWYMDRDVAAAMNLYFADPATDSYDLKAEQSALARLKQVSGNAGSIVRYKPANRQDEAVLRRNRRIELMKPVPVERLRFKCSCGAGDARADKASKTLAVTEKPAPCQETPRFQARVV